jgi:hypothetical protein
MGDAPNNSEAVSLLTGGGQPPVFPIAATAFR